MAVNITVYPKRMGDEGLDCAGVSTCGSAAQRVKAEGKYRSEGVALNKHTPNHIIALKQLSKA